MLNSRRRALGFGVAAAAVALIGSTLAAPPRAGASSTSPAAPGPLVRVGRLSPGAAPAGAQNLGSAPVGASLGVQVVLAPSNPAAVQSLLSQLYDPSSPLYHHWLKPGQFDEDFGPSASTVSTAEAWLRQRGLSPKQTSTFSLSVASPIGRLSSAFGTSFSRYRTSSGAQGYLAQGAPLIPSNLVGQVQAVLGLDTLPVARPASRRVPVTAAGSRVEALRPAGGRGTAAALPADSSCESGQDASSSSNGAYTFTQLASSSEGYGISSLQGSGLTGSDQTIALFELESYDSSDIQAFESCVGLNSPISNVYVSDGLAGSIPSPSGEATIDIEQAATQAPGANLEVYEAPNDWNGFVNEFSAIVNASSPAPVVSVSWGICENPGNPQDLSSSDAQALDPLLSQAATQGQSVIVASGDQGSAACDDPNAPGDGNTGSTTALSASYPASSPYVTSAGGTYLARPGSELAWNDCQLLPYTQPADSTYASCNSFFGGSEGAGGGGASVYETDTAGYTQPGYAGHREVPDISANAGIPMDVYFNGAWSTASGEYFEGTSLAAPLIAGLVADRDQGCAARTGNFDNVLYGLYDQPGHNYGIAFNPVSETLSGAGGPISITNNDLVEANGGQYPVGSGYDQVTGIGTPIAAGLACPEVQWISTPAAVPGTQVTINGVGLEGASVYFSGIPAAVVSSSPTSATVTVPSGSGAVTVRASSALLGSGTQAASFFIQGPPVAASFSAPQDATIPEGTTMILSTQLTAGGIGLAYQTVDLESRPATSGVWGLAAYQTDPTGTVKVGVKPVQNEVYRWFFPGTSAYTTATSASATVAVAQTVSIARTAWSIRRGHTDTIYGLVSPNELGRTVYLYELLKKTRTEIVKGRRIKVVVQQWTLIGRATIKRQRLPNHRIEIGYSMTIRLNSRGTFLIHTFRSATSHNAAGQSADVLIRVT